MIRYRPHRGALADAMAEMVELPDRAALDAHIRATVGTGAIEVLPYFSSPDPRTGWPTTYLVRRNRKPVGFCDTP